jgi:hypothetical protein
MEKGGCVVVKSQGSVRYALAVAAVHGDLTALEQLAESRIRGEAEAEITARQRNRTSDGFFARLGDRFILGKAAARVESERQWAILRECLDPGAAAAVFIGAAFIRAFCESSDFGVVMPFFSGVDATRAG